MAFLFMTSELTCQFILYWFLLSIGILCLAYYLLIIIYNGYGTAFSPFWLVTGFVSVILSFFINSMMVHKIRLAGSLMIIVFLILLIGLVLFFFIEGIIIYHSKYKEIPKVDYLIVLGAQVRGTVITKSLQKRLNTAASYLIEYPDTIAIVSGGKGEKEDLAEAEAMKNFLLKQGIAGSRIVKEDKSRNTFENILYSKAFIKPYSSVAVVTSGFHIFRSLRIAKKQGLDKLAGLAAPTDCVLAVNYYVREAVGVLKDKFFGNI